MPTRRGRVSLIFGVVLYLAARIVSIHELYALALAAIVFPLLAVVFVRAGRHRLAFSRTIAPPRVFAGGTTRATITVRNGARIPSPPLVIDDPAPASAGGAVRFAAPSLRAGSGESYTAERHATARGRATIGPLRARLVDPFGLAETAREVAPAATLVVYPRIEALHERTPREARTGTGRSAVHQIATAGDEFYAVRGWQEGDDLRKIHWRSTARRAELMIRQDEIRPFPRATILVDTRAAAHHGASLEWALSAAASVVWELARQGFALRLVTADAGPASARWGREASDPLLTALALVERSGARSLVPAVRRAGAHPGAGGALLAILPPPAPDLIAPLSRARRAYGWCGAVLLDTPSFDHPSARERAAFDQRLADSDHSMERAGWRVAVASSADAFKPIWESLIDAGAYRPSSPSRRS